MTGHIEEIVAKELIHWQQAGMVARVWVRDDDAIEVSDALAQFDKLISAHGGSFVMASMPGLATPALADWVHAREHVRVAQHGLVHENRARDGEKKCELPCSVSLEQMVAELSAGYERMAALFGEKFLPMLVPPWNRICPALVPELGQAGFELLSTYGWQAAGDGIVSFNTHVDIIDWRGSRGGKPANVVAGDLVAALREARGRGGEPVGILTHHLVHDETADRVLDDVFSLIANHRALNWISFPGNSDSDR